MDQNSATITVPELRDLIQKLYNLRSILSNALLSTLLPSTPKSWVVVSKCQRRVIIKNERGFTTIGTTPIELPYFYLYEDLATKTAAKHNAEVTGFIWVVAPLKEYLTFAIPQLQDQIDTLEKILPNIDETPKGLN